MNERIGRQKDQTPLDSEQCFHGGAFFEVIGHEFQGLHAIPDVINADVLDAWFPPCPQVISLLTEHLPWVIKTSPPTECEGLTDCISRVRGIPQESVLPGSGSSSLIFLALRHWLSSSSKVLILDPSYGEYSHVVEKVVGCSLDQFVLRAENDFRVDVDELQATLRFPYDLVVVVNPNNPTGQHIPRQELEDLILSAAPSTKFWIDEAYVDFVSKGESLETFAAQSNNTVVCKSMSKVYALSGLRVGYLCGPPSMIGPLRVLNPPWAVSLPGQLAAINAMQDPSYYAEKYDETYGLRQDLAQELLSLAGMRMVPGRANFLLFELPPDAPPSDEVILRCRKKNLFLRDPGVTNPRLGSRWLRIAVKDRDTNLRMAKILEGALSITVADMS